jgi:phage terminase small subunit
VADLTYKQRLFVDAYLGQANGNATEAARIAGYAWPEKVAHRLVGKSGIRAKISQRVACATLSANEVLARVAEHATADIGEYIEIDDTGDRTVNLERARRRDKLRNIRKIKQGEHGVEIKLKDSFPALVQLGKFHGLWDREPTDANELAQAIKANLREKAKERLQRRAGKPDASGPGSTDG